MNEKNFAGLLQGVKEMAAHMCGHAVASVTETRVQVPDMCNIGEVGGVGTGRVSRKTSKGKARQ